MKKTIAPYLLSIALPLYFCAPATLFADLDDDLDGLSDVWERQYAAQNLDATADDDADGHNNQQESIAGTNPLDSASRLDISNISWQRDGSLNLSWPSQAGKVYEAVFGSGNTTVTWEPEGTEIYGSGLEMSLRLAPNAAPQAFGGITREVWNNLPGTRISALTESAAFAGAPDGSHIIDALDTADHGNPDFGARLRGWIVPKESRSVVFYIAAGSQAEFYFSTTDGADDATRICRTLEPTQPHQWHKTPFQQSLPYGVETGKRYYIEVIQKHAAGDDHVAIGWRDFEETEIEIIGGDELAPWLDTTQSASAARLDAGDFRYVAISVRDEDKDADSVSTWEETKIGGLNPFLSFSKSGTSDFTAIQKKFFASTDEINVTASAPIATEKEGTPGTFRITRSGSVDAITINFSLSGDSDAAKGSADSADYYLEDASGNPVTNSVALPFGAAFVDVMVHGIQDYTAEVPETLTLTITPDPAYTVGATDSAAVSIRNAENTAANQRLFLGYMGSENQAETSASGIVSVLLQGDNDTALVNMTFSGLTTEQSAAHIHVANPVSGPIVQGLPLGQVAEFEWAIRAAQFMNTDQAVLDALYAGQLYANVHSEKYPGGEIRGDLNFAAVSSSLQLPDAPPSIPVLSGTDLDRDIVRFLQQATFGATTGSVAELKAMVADPTIGNGNQMVAYEAWINQQMNTTLTPSMDLAAYTEAVMLNMTNSNPHEARRYGMWLNGVYGKDQLRQRMAFALSQIFVTSDQDTTLRNIHIGMAHYYQALTDNAFGTYEELLMLVTKSPVMGHYLSHLRNQKAVLDGDGKIIVSPDENYAREIMQLFSAGLVELHLDGTIAVGPGGLPFPTYDNGTITEMAKVFTGLGFGMYHNGTTEVENNYFFRGNSSSEPGQTRWSHPMKMFDNYHDTGEKAIIENVIIPPGLSGETDLQIMCAVLGNHGNTAPFVARRLIQRFVTSNPSRAYIYRVAKTFDDTKGNLGATLKAVLLDYEARSFDEVNKVTFGKPKEPVIKMIALQRAMNPASNMPLSALSAHGYPAAELAKFPAGVTRLRYRDHDDLGQVMHNSPSVFNFFLPDFSKPGKLSLAGLVTPELQVKTESQIYDYINEIYDVTVNRRVTGDGVPDTETDNNADNIYFDDSYFQDIYDAALTAAGGDVPAATEVLVDAIDALLNAGSLRAEYLNAPTPNARSEMIDAIAGVTASWRVRNAMYITINSPQFSTQK